MITTNFPYGGGKTVTSVNGVHGDVIIGGVNLMRNTDFSQGIEKWLKNGRGTIGVYTLDDSKTALKFTSNSENGTHYLGQDVAIQGNETITWSALVYTEESLNISIDIEGWATEWNTLHKIDRKTESVNGWRKMVLTVKTNQDDTNIRATFRLDDNVANKTFYIYHPKLEYGNVATDWTPAPVDILARLDALEAKLNISHSDEEESGLEMLDAQEERLEILERKL